MSEQRKSKGWPEIAVITKNPVRKKDSNGNFIKDGNGNYENLTDQGGNVIFNLGFKLADNVTVLVDGQPVALNKGRTGIMKTPPQEVEELYKRQQIPEDKIEFRRSKAAEVYEWLRYKVILPPPRD